MKSRVIRQIKNQKCMLEIGLAPEAINQDAAREILVESFIGEYSQYLQPHEIGEGLTSWRGNDEFSVQHYYEEYFRSEFKEYCENKLDYWICAYVKDEVTNTSKLVGWATFQREEAEEAAVYMNLLVVHPAYQRFGIGEQLTKSLMYLNVIPDLSAIHLLLRIRNVGGLEFYKKIGFELDPHYQRKDNYVDLSLLTGLTWRNPALEYSPILRVKCY